MVPLGHSYLHITMIRNINRALELWTKNISNGNTNILVCALVFFAKSKNKKYAIH